MANRSHTAEHTHTDGRTDWGAPRVVSATDLTFLWEDCPSCFHRKVVLGERRPASPFPSVFNRIDRAMKRWYIGAGTGVLPKDLVGATVVNTDLWVCSEELVPPGCAGAVMLRGRVDALVAFPDDTLGVVDFKCLPADTERTQVYFPQLSTYSWALNHPARREPRSIERMGLLCFAPAQYEAVDDRASLSGTTSWLEVERDDEAFLDRLTQVGKTLDQPEVPASDPDCRFCRWRVGARRR